MATTESLLPASRAPGLPSLPAGGRVSADWAHDSHLLSKGVISPSTPGCRCIELVWSAGPGVPIEGRRLPRAAHSTDAMRDDGDFVFYNQPRHASDAVRHLRQAGRLRCHEARVSPTDAVAGGPALGGSGRRLHRPMMPRRTAGRSARSRGCHAGCWTPGTGTELARFDMVAEVRPPWSAASCTGVRGSGSSARSAGVTSPVSRGWPRTSGSPWTTLPPAAAPAAPATRPTPPTPQAPNATGPGSAGSRAAARSADRAAGAHRCGTRLKLGGTPPRRHAHATVPAQGTGRGQPEQARGGPGILRASSGPGRLRVHVLLYPRAWSRTSWERMAAVAAQRTTTVRCRHGPSLRPRPGCPTSASANSPSGCGCTYAWGDQPLPPRQEEGACIPSRSTCGRSASRTRNRR